MGAVEETTMTPAEDGMKPTDLNGAEPNEPSAATKPETLSSLAILTTVKAAQGAHGMKHGDFERYRQYCTRRLHRIRRATKLQLGRGRFSQRTVTVEDVIRDDRALLIPLTEAERAWATAMEVKRAAQNGDLDIGAGKVRRKVVGKLQRAVEATDRLREICKVTCDETTILEVEAYSKWMLATLHLEREEWTKAMAAFEVVGRVYSGMIAMLAGSAAAGVFEERSDEVATAVRFCRYNLARSGGGGNEEELLRDIQEAGGGDDMLSEKIDMVLAEARKKAAQSLGEVIWCGNTVPLRSEKIQEAVLVANQQSEALKADPERTKSIDAYDSVFIAYNDAIQVVRKEIADYRDATTTSAEERIAELELLMGYITHGRIGHTVQRNLILVQSFRDKKSSKPEDFVRLYDNLVQNMTDILGLRGVDMDPALSDRTESQRTVYRAYRCFHLAECYRLAGSLAEAAALYDRVGVLARPLTGEHAEEAAKVVEQSRGMKCRIRASEFIKQAMMAEELAALSLSTTSGAAEKPLGQKQLMVDHLDAFVSFANDDSGRRAIVDMPPALEAVPCKPMFYDLAIDGIKIPEPTPKEDTSKQTEKQAAPETQNKGTYFSRWWSK